MENKEVLRLISIFLQYPNKEWTDIELNEIESIQHSHPTIYPNFVNFFKYIQQYTLDELKEQYVHTFDFNDKTNLYLTYTKMKEEKERGQILVELKQLYANSSFMLETEELPDYFPLLIEFLSITDEKIYRKLVKQFLPPVLRLKNELHEIDSPYVSLLEAYIEVVSQDMD